LLTTATTRKPAMTATGIEAKRIDFHRPSGNGERAGGADAAVVRNARAVR